MPPQDLGMITLSSWRSVRVSISWMVWVLCPLLVTAANFRDRLTAIFRGRSPSDRLVPAGVRDQPLGRRTLLLSRVERSWALPRKEAIEITSASARKEYLYINLFFYVVRDFGILWDRYQPGFCLRLGLSTISLVGMG